MLHLKLTQWIQKIWGISPIKLDFYRKAVTLPEYESLEFLGDSLLDFIVADYLVNRFPGKPPGWLTKKRMTLVNENALAMLGAKIGLDNIAIFPPTSSREQITTRVLGDMVEALIAAIYMDQGIEVARNAIQKLMELDKITEELTMAFLDPISIVQEYLAHKGLPPPVYKIIKVSGTEHEPIFEMEAVCNIDGHSVTSRGKGKSKKEASKEAAQEFLKKIKNFKIQTPEKSLLSFSDKKNILEELHIFLSQKGINLPVYKEIESGSSNNFIIQATCEYKGNLFIEKGQSSSKKKAKQEAAQKIFQKIPKN